MSTEVLRMWRCITHSRQTRPVARRLLMQRSCRSGSTAICYTIQSKIDVLAAAVSPSGMSILVLSLIVSVLMIASGTQAQTFIEALSNVPDLSKLAALLQPYAKDLENLTNVTFVAPNNVAVNQLLNSSAGAALATDANMGYALMSYHILNGTHPEYFGTSSELTFVPTALRPPNWSNVTGGQRVQIVASSGNEEATVLSGLRQTAKLTNCTSFAGGDLYVSDKFLTIPQNLSSTAIDLNLTSAVGLLTCFPGVLQAVNVYADVTMFVPNNEAFQAIGGNLAKMTSATLSQIIDSHVISSHIFYSPELQDGKSIGTLWGNLTVTRSGEDIYINNARIIQLDILITNGVLHVMDRVLNPADTSASIGAQAFPQASSVTYVPFTSGIQTATSYIPITGYPTSASASNPSSIVGSSGSSSNTTAIAGGVVGGILGRALILIILWFIRRRQFTKSDGSFGRKDTTKSYRKPELEAATRPELGSTTRTELESTTTALSQSDRPPKNLVEPAVYEVGQVSTPRVLRVNSRDHRDPITAQKDSSDEYPGQWRLYEEAILAQRQQEHIREQQRQRDQEEQEMRMMEVENQRRLAELDYQRRMTELEHEQRMTEFNISVARIRSHSRTVSELEGRVNPGPGSEIDRASLTRKERHVRRYCSPAEETRTFHQRER